MDRRSHNNQKLDIYTVVIPPPLLTREATCGAPNKRTARGVAVSVCVCWHPLLAISLVPRNPKTAKGYPRDEVRIYRVVIPECIIKLLAKCKGESKSRQAADWADKMKRGRRDTVDPLDAFWIHF